jgi:hypothetical protein
LPTLGMRTNFFTCKNSVLAVLART